MKKRQQKSFLVQKPSSLTLVEIELVLKIEWIKTFMYQNTIREWMILFLLWHFEPLLLSNTGSWTCLCVPIWTWSWNTWMSTFVPCAELLRCTSFPRNGAVFNFFAFCCSPSTQLSSPLLGLRWTQELCSVREQKCETFPEPAWKQWKQEVVLGSLEHTSCGLKTDKAAEGGL